MQIKTLTHLHGGKICIDKISDQLRGMLIMVDSRNVKFEVSPDPAFQLVFNPGKVEQRIFKADNIVPLYNKLETTQLLGFIVEFDLIWEAPVLFNESQQIILKDLFKGTDPFYFYPNPSAMPALKYLVRWANALEFKSSNGWMDGWGWLGTINLVGAELLQAGDLDDWDFYDY